MACHVVKMWIHSAKKHYIIIIGTTGSLPSSKCSVVYVIISESPETRLVPISIPAISMHKIESRDISNREYLSKTILACRERQAKNHKNKKFIQGFPFDQFIILLYTVRYHNKATNFVIMQFQMSIEPTVYIIQQQNQYLHIA